MWQNRLETTLTHTVSKRQRLYSVSIEDTLKTYCVCRGIEVSIEEESTLRTHTVSKRQKLSIEV